MDVKSNKGGFRKGAGRKTIDNPKKQVTLYVEKNLFYGFGNEEKMKKELYNFIKEKNGVGEPNYLIQDFTKPTNEIKPHEQPKNYFEVNIPPKQEMPILVEFEALKAEILETQNLGQLKSVMTKVKTTLLTFYQKRDLEAIAKQHSENKGFFND